MNAKDIAKQATKGGVQIMEGREKISTEQVMRDYPNGITISDYDFLPDQKTGELYAVVIFEENEKAFLFGGTVLTNIANLWKEAGVTADDLKAEPVKLRFFDGKTKQGRPFINVEVID